MGNLRVASVGRLSLSGSGGGKLACPRRSSRGRTVASSATRPSPLPPQAMVRRHKLRQPWGRGSSSRLTPADTCQPSPRTPPSGRLRANPRGQVKARVPYGLPRRPPFVCSKRRCGRRLPTRFPAIRAQVKTLPIGKGTCCHRRPASLGWTLFRGGPATSVLMKSSALASCFRTRSLQLADCLSRLISFERRADKFELSRVARRAKNVVWARQRTFRTAHPTSLRNH